MRYIVGLIILAFLFSIWLAVVFKLANSVRGSIIVVDREEEKNEGMRLKMTIEDLKEKLAEVKEEMEVNWLQDEDGMEEYEVHNAYEKLDVFEEVLEMLENSSDPLDIGQRLGQ